jgi:hypothetical protein
MSATPIAMAGGAFIFLGVIVGLFLAVAYSYYTRRGSGINQRPRGGERGDAQAGAAGPSRISAAEAGDQPPADYEN